MKLIYSALFVTLLFASCKSKSDSAANEAFEKNSKTVLAYLEGVQKEKIDYSSFSKDFKSLNTWYGAKDTISLEEFKIGDSKALKNFNFKLLDSVPVFLPGVNSLTKIVDGSVRIYSTWEISTEKTDSTEAKSGRLKMYESYDFDADGKILYQQGYGDFSGLMNYLTSK
ncbi:MAG: hypothetical protein EXR18_00915 [Flavobacteriaceae bacterium]|nr:hypothetical protein [Flavobacteriaceae bacterium]